MGSQRFRAVIAAGPRNSAVIMVPFNPDETWGAKADHPVSGTIGGYRTRTRLVPADRGWVLPLTAKRLISMGIAITRAHAAAVRASTPGGHGMILIGRGVDIENTTYRVDLAGVGP